MILKAEIIAEHIRRAQRRISHDPLLIVPCPNLEMIERSGAASIDLRLGTWFVTLRQARMGYLAVEDEQYQYAKTKYVPFGTEYFLHPNSFVLGVTLEWIRVPANLAGFLTGKSSWGRRGLIVETAAEVHPGFKGCLTLELSNAGEIPIAIKPGMTICQLCLMKVETDDQQNIDQSKFVGRRQPSVGKIFLDDFAKKLSKFSSNRLYSSI